MNYVTLGFVTWQMQNFTAAEAADPALGGMLGNPDGDLTLNIEEFLYGGDPKRADSAGTLPFITVEQIEDESFAVVNVRVDMASMGVNWKITSSLDGAQWTPIDLIELAAQDLGNGIMLKRFRMSAPLRASPDGTRLFRVELDG